MEVELKDFNYWMAHTDLTKPLKKSRAARKKVQNGLDKGSGFMVQ